MVTGRTAGAVIASMRRLATPPVTGARWWLLVFAVAAGTNLLDFLSLAAPGAPHGGAFVAAAVVRVLLVFWVGYALTRRMAGVARPATLTLGFVAYLAVSLLFTVPAVVLARLLHPMSASQGVAGAAALLFVAQVLSGLILLRLLAWQTSLAVGDRMGFAAAWRGIGGAWAGLAAGLLALVPVAAVHLALTVGAMAATGGSTVTIALVDGAVSTVQLVLMTALGVTAWAIARDRA